MTFARCDRFRHSVIDTCEAINGGLSGTADPINPDELAEARAWLRWRIGQGWERSGIGRFASYDRAVRALARAALRLK